MTGTGDYDPNDLPMEGGIGEPCPCAPELVCIAGLCGPCPVGQLGCACGGRGECDLGLGCAEALDGADVCGVLADPAAGCFEHGLALDLPAVEVDGVCVAGCEQGQDCGWLECSPIDASSQGFCANI